MFLTIKMTNSLDNLGNFKISETRKSLNTNADKMNKKLINRKLQNPIITIPQIEFTKKNTLSKNFTDVIDLDFKTRPSQLSDSHFKDFKNQFDINDKNYISGHFLPGHILEKQCEKQNIESIVSKNKLKNIKCPVYSQNNRIDTDKISVKQKNILKNIQFDSSREIGIRPPIVQIIQHREKIIEKI